MTARSSGRGPLLPDGLSAWADSLMGEPRPELGVMAAPEELIDALHAFGAIRAPSRAERASIERHGQSGRVSSGSPRAASCSGLECAHHLAGVVEMQVLMAAGAAADAIEEPAAEDSTRVLMGGWELFSGASADQD
jgi:hypothetical protein